MTHLRLQNVSKTYTTEPILHQLDLSVSKGEFLVVVGNSGCGKSTLLRLIAGLEPLSAGTMFIGDRCIDHLAPKDRNIAMVFQNYALYPHMTVYNNIAYGLKQRNYSKAVIANRVGAVAETLGLSAYLDRKPAILSGGQRQRVAMGRAMVREPDVFLFDEPLSNLDTALRGQMRLELKQLQQSLETTSVYVTHDQIEAMTLADRLVVLNKGKIEQMGAPLSLYQKPASLFVAQFMGSPAMNLIPGIVVEQGVQINGTHCIPFPNVPLAIGHKVTLGIRPEEMRLTKREGAALLLTITLIERIGADTFAYGSLAGKRCSVRLSPDVPAKLGDTLPLAIATPHWHVFDATTGLRVEVTPRHCERSVAIQAI